MRGYPSFFYFFGRRTKTLVDTFCFYLFFFSPFFSFLLLYLSPILYGRLLAYIPSHLYRVSINDAKIFLSSQKCNSVFSTDEHLWIMRPAGSLQRERQQILAIKMDFSRRRRWQVGCYLQRIRCISYICIRSALYVYMSLLFDELFVLVIRQLICELLRANRDGTYITI